ncbi:MAG: hypothetical protein PHV57_00790 [Methanomicrobiaceae archaeon]|nr:hypothetical protein [Methanomicrobiaceae archaeon]
MEEYAPGVAGEVRFVRTERGYCVELYDAAGKPLAKTGMYTTEAKAKEAARKLAAKVRPG